MIVPKLSTENEPQNGSASSLWATQMFGHKVSLLRSPWHRRGGVASMGMYRNTHLWGSTSGDGREQTKGAVRPEPLEKSHYHIHCSFLRCDVLCSTFCVPRKIPTPQQQLTACDLLKQ